MTATVRIDVSDILLILGVLRRSSPAATPELDPAWFENPLTGLGRMLVDEHRLDQLTELLGALFGETPEATDRQVALAGSERWHPVFADPGGAAQTGITLGLVTNRVGATTSVGAGGLVDVPTGTVRTQISAVLPLFDGTVVGSAAPTFTASTDPIRVALRAGPLGGGAIAIEQISLVARIPRSTTGTPMFRLGIAGVTIAGQPIDDFDIDLAHPPDDLAGRLVSLALQVAEAGAGSPVLSSLLDLLGLGHRPGVPDMPLEDLLGDGPELAFAAWLRLLLAPGTTAQADPLRAWLETLAELLGRVLDPTAATLPTVATTTEDGTTVHQLPISSALRIEVRRRTTPTGSEVVLGLALLADRGTSGRGSISLQLARFDLDPAGALRGIRPVGTTQAAVEVGSATAPLVPAGTLAGGQAFGLASVEIGLRVDEVQLARPVVELHGLTVGGTPHARLDLSSPDAIAAAGTSLIGDVVTAVGDALGVGSQAQALAVLLGLRTPDGAMGWPALLGPTLFSAPLDAIAGFYAAALADPAMFALLLAHVPVVLDQRTEPDAGTVTGIGTGSAPWRVPLFDDALGTVALTAFVADHGPLVIGLDADPSPIRAGEVTLAVTVGAELLALTLPVGGTGAAAALAPAVHARLGAAIAETIQVGPAILGPVQVEVQARFDATKRTLAAGLTLALDTAEVHGLRVAVAPVRLALGDDAGVALWSAVPWTAVELLAGALLCDRSSGGDGPLAAVAGLLGWAPWLADRPVTVETGTATVTVPVPLGQFPMLRLDELLRAPSEGLASWVRRLVGDEAEPPREWGVPFQSRPAGPDGDPDVDTEGPETEVVDIIIAEPVRRDLSFAAAALLAALLPAGSTASTGWRCRLRGAGSRDDPWAVPLVAGADAAAVQLWLDRDAPPALPAAVVDALVASPPTGGSLTDHLADQLRLAAAFLGVGDWVGDEATLPTRLAAAAQAATDTDGVLRPQAGSAPSIVAGHHHVPAHLDDASAALAVPLVPADTVVVRAPLPGQRGARLAGVNLAAEVDLAGGVPDQTTLSATGPWAAVLPEPDAGVDGALLLRNLLGRIAATRAAAAGPLDVVAIGSAAAAARVGTAGLGIGRLVTVAAPITGTATGTPTGLGLLVELRRAVDDLSELAGAVPPALGVLDEIEYTAALLPGGWVPAGDGQLRYRPFPSGWYAPAAPAAGEMAVFARLDRAAVDNGMIRLVQAVVAVGFAARAGALDRPADGLHLGARLRVAGSGGSPGIAAAARMELASLALAGPVQEAGRRRVELSTQLWRDDAPLLAPAGGAGLLVGDAEVQAVVDTWDGTVELALRARRVEVLGVRLPTMVVGGVQDGADLVRLAPEERIVVSAVLELLGAALPATGQVPASPLAALAALAEDLGLLVREPTGVIAPLGPIERLLSDPTGELEALLNDAPVRARLMARLAGLAGTAATVNPDATVVTMLVGPLALTVDAGAAPEVRLGFATVIGQVALRGALALDGHGRIQASVETVSGAAGAGTPVTTVGLGPLPAAAPQWPVLRLSFDTAAGQPVTAEIVVPAGLPGAGTAVSYTDDPGAMVEALGWSLLGELAAAGLAVALDAQPARLTPLLTALGMLRGTRVVNPLPFVLDPLGWLGRPDVLGATAPTGALDLAKVGTLVQAVATLLGAVGGVATLPGQASLALVTTGTAPGAELRWDLGVARVAVDVRRRSGEWRVGFDAVGVLAVTAAGVPIRTVRFVGRVDAGGPALTVELVTPSGAALPLGLLPPLPLANLAELASTAATVLVPAVLDALAELAPTAPAVPTTAPEFVGTAVTALGEALALRKGTPPAFDATRLQALATDPVSYLAANLQPGRLVQALGPAARTIFPTAVSISGTTTTIQVAPLRVDMVPGTADLDATVTVVVPVPTTAPAVTVTGTVTLNSTTGLQDAELAVAFVGDLLTIGQVTLHPTVTVGVQAAAGGFVVRGELDLPVEPPGTDQHRLVLAVATSATGSAPIASLACRHGTVVDPNLDACLVDAAKNIVLPLVIDLVLDNQDLQDWLGDNGTGTQPRAEPLTPGLLERQDNRYRRRLDALDDDKVLAHLLQAAAKVASRLASKSHQLGRYVQISVGSEGDWCGITASLTDRILLGATEDWSIELGTDPFLAPQLASVTVLAVKTGPGFAAPYSLALGVRSRGIGLHVTGPEGKPLLAQAPVRLGALGLYGSAGPQWSVALVAERLAIDLGSAAGGGPGVAKGLLAPGGAAGGDGTPAAPGVDVRLAITSQGPTLAFAGRDGFPIWAPIHRALGPLRVEQIGVDIVPRPAPNTTVDLKSIWVGVLVDASLAVGPLSAVVDDLRLLVPVKDPRPRNWSIDVAGFAVGFDNQAVTLAGALRKPTGAEGDYLGFLSLRAATIGLGLLGGYGQYGVGADRYTSLFIFGVLKAPFGGPPAFFLTGVGAGAGINRGLAPPPAGAIEQSLFLQSLDCGIKVGPDTLTQLASTFPARRGAYWFAAGVSFTSFVFIQAVAVLTVDFDPTGFDIALLALARFALPPAGPPVVNIELAVDGRFSSRTRAVTVLANFTANSWLIDPSCRITGGIAMGLWFDNGDFVVSLGGYHPDYRVPARYPVPKRLGLDWQATESAHLTAAAYFALTPQAVMTGIRGEASIQLDWCGASATIGFDAIIFWDPLHFRFDLHVDVTGWVLIGSAHVSLTVGADVRVEGPPLEIDATVRFAGIAIPLRLGEGGAGQRRPLTWQQLVDRYLTGGSGKPPLDVVLLHGDLPVDGRDGSRAAPLAVAPAFALVTRTALPARRFVAGSAAGGAAPDADRLGVPALWVSSYEATHTVRLVRVDGTTETPVTGDKLQIRPRFEYQPAATWGAFPFLNLVDGKMSDGPATVRAVAGGTVTADRVPSPGRRGASSRQLEQATQRLLPLAFVDEPDLPPVAVLDRPPILLLDTVGQQAYVADLVQRPRPSGLDVAVQSAQPVTAEPAPTTPALPPAPTPVAVVGLRRPATSAAAIATTVEAQAVRVPAPSMAAVQAAARGWSVLLKVPATAGVPADDPAAGAASGRAAAEHRWVAGTAEPLPAHLAGSLAKGVTVPLTDLTSWRADGPGRFSWRSERPCRVVVVDGDGLLSADTLGHTGAVDVAGGGSTVAVAPGTVPMAPFLAVWVTARPVLWIDAFLGLVPGGVLVAPLVGGVAGVAPVRVDGSPVTLATSARATGSVGVVLPAGAGPELGGVRLAVSGAGLAAVEPVTAQGVDGRWVALWDLESPQEGGTSVSITGREAVDVVFIADQPAAELVGLLARVTVEAAAEAAPTGSDGTAAVRWTPGDLR